MLGRSIALVFRGLSIYRWNNFPRVEQVSETDNRAFVLHTAVFLAKILEEKEGLHPDIGYIVRRILFSSFTTFIHSDISSEVRERLRAKRPDIDEALTNAAFDAIREWLPEKIQHDMDAFRNPKSGRDIEENIIAFAKIWVSHREVVINDRVYFGAYTTPLENIRKKYNEDRFEMLRKYLHIEEFQFTEIEMYLLAIRKLQSSFRWNRRQRRYPISVMSHSFTIMYITYIIGVLEKKTESEITEMMLVALFHDVPEAITGDIITPTKKAVEGFEECLTEIEEDMVDAYLLGSIQHFAFTKDLKRMMLTPWTGENGPLVKLADIFSALFEAKLEAESSQEFKEAFIRIKKVLATYSYQSIDTLFKLGVDYFDDDLETVVVFKKPGK